VDVLVAGREFELAFVKLALHPPQPAFDGRQL
jgi:hypothetical protein